jgi:glucosamine kinase
VGPPVVLRHKGCGGELGEHRICTRCSELLEVGEVRAEAGPGQAFGLACEDPRVQRAPLVQLPPELSPPGIGGVRGGARFVLGIDGGATKTLAALLDLERGMLHLGQAGPSNEDAVGTRKAVDALLEAADEAVGRAGIEGERLAAEVIALAGTDTDAVARHVRAARSEDWLVVNDVVAAWATATEAQPGIGVISGTGSNVFGVGFDGRSWRAGGWGHQLGDEGSGYWFGNESIKAALRDREASGPQTALSDAAVAFFGVASVEALAALVYSKPLSKGEIAAFAIETAKLAAGGDEVACGIYRRGAALLGEQVTAVIHRTGLAGGGDGASGFTDAGAGSGSDNGARTGEARGFPVGLIGSAYKAGAVFVEPLTRAVHELAPEARVSVVEMAPVGGSLLLAMRACGCEGALSAVELAGLIDDALAAESSAAV